MEFSFKNIIKKGRNAFIVQGITIFITLLLNWYLAQQLGAENYGVFTYAFSWVYLFGNISMLGLHSVLQREIIKYTPDKIKGLIKFSRKVNLIVSLLIVFCFSFIVFFFYPSLTTYFKQNLLLAILSLPFFSLLLINKSVLIGLKKVITSLISEQLIRPLILLISLLVLWQFYPPDTLTAVVLNLIAIIIAMFFSYLIVSKSKPISQESSENNKAWLKLGLTFFVFTLTITINSYADILMLGFFGFTEKVGIYNIAVKLSLLISLPLVISNKIIIPYISKYHQENKEKLATIIKKTTRLISVIGTFIFLIYAFFGSEMMHYFGKEFTIGCGALIILSTAQLINVFVGPVGNLLTMSKHEKIAVKIMIISTLLNIALNFILIPLFDINGAAISTATSLAFWNITLLFYVKKHLNINPTIF